MQTKAATIAAAKKMVGVKGMPNPAWPLSYGNYCMASVALWCGLRTRDNLNINVISIAAFRSHYHWPQFPLSKAQAGDFVLLEWEEDGRTEADHIGLVIAVAGDKQSVTTIEGNTGPRPGVADPNGFYQRTRYAANIIGVVRPPYATIKPPAPAPAPAPVKEDKIQSISARDFGANQKLPYYQWTTVQLDQPNQYSLVGGIGNWAFNASFIFDGLPVGGVVQVRFIRTNQEKVIASSPIVEILGTPGRSFGALSRFIANTGAADRIRVQVMSQSEGVTLVSGDAQWHS